MNIKELQNLTVKQLQKKATQLGNSEYIGLKKQELIKLILDCQVEKEETVYATGVLEVLPDGYGFLRFSNYSYLPGPDDIYVSHSQIKRFRLKTGHLISGQIRPPKDKEKFFAGQLDLLSKLKVSEEEQPKIQEQKDAIERQKSEEMEAISRAAQTEINSMYAKINLLTEFIADGFELKKK